MPTTSKDLSQYQELVEERRRAQRAKLRGEKPVSYLGTLTQRTERAAAEARKFNETILPDHQENMYRAGMNAIAEKFWNLAKNDKSDPNELRLYADLLLKHFEQKIKSEKIAIMGRHLQLLEQKAKALETAVRNARSPSELGAYVREVLFPQTNGHKVETPLLQNGITS